LAAESAANDFIIYLSINMPQLDHVSFFSQYFWLCIFFFTFYVGLLKGFMPKMSRALKLRSAKTGETGGSLSTVEQDTVSGNINSSLIGSLNACKKGFVNHFESTQDWCTRMHTDAMNGALKESNSLYLTKLASTCLDQRLVQAQLDVILPPTASVPNTGAKKDMYLGKLVNSLRKA